MLDFILELLSHLLGITAVGMAAFLGAKTAIDELLEADCENCDGCECCHNCQKPIYEPENKEE